MVNKLLPLLDHLYIFQNFEYEPITFLKWFFDNLFKRNLQKKHKLSLTIKAWLLLLLAVILQVFFVISYALLTIPENLFFIPFYILAYLFTQFFSPVFLVLAWIILYPLEAYQKNKITTAAREKLSKLPNLQVIAITGSFAKTSTKEALYTLLWKDFRVVKTPKSFNTEVSIARSILSDVKENTEVFIVEMDAYHPGEIRKLANLVKPTMGVITSIAPQHLERFGSMEKLAKTQFELGESLPEDGLLILNSDSEWILKLEDQYQQNEQSSFASQNKCFYGDREEDQFKARNIKQTQDSLNFEMRTPQGITQISLPLFGEHHTINFLAAAAVAQNLGVSLKKIQQRAGWILPTPHRLEVKKQGELTIIDNTYNTNPVASKSSLSLLKSLDGKHKVLITPGLVELGKEHEAGNMEFAKNASEVADEIVIVGEFAKKELLKGFHEAEYPREKIHLAKSTGEALQLLPSLTKPETVVLLENDLPDQYF